MTERIAALALHWPSRPENIGGALRAAGVYRVKLVVLGGGELPPGPLGHPTDMKQVWRRISEADLELLWTALERMFDDDRSAARGEMAARRLVVFLHASPLGNPPPRRRPGLQGQTPPRAPPRRGHDDVAERGDVRWRTEARPGPRHRDLTGPRRRRLRRRVP